VLAAAGCAFSALILIPAMRRLEHDEEWEPGVREEPVEALAG